MADTKITLNLDASQAISEATAVNNALGTLNEQLKEATAAGKWNHAAETLQHAQKERIEQLPQLTQNVHSYAEHRTQQMPQQAAMMPAPMPQAAHIPQQQAAGNVSRNVTAENNAPVTMRTMSAAIPMNTDRRTLNEQLKEATAAGKWNHAAETLQHAQKERAEQLPQLNQSVLPYAEQPTKQMPQQAAMPAQMPQAAHIPQQQAAGNVSRNVTAEAGAENRPAGYLGSAETANNAKRLDMRLEILTKTIAELTSQLEEATENGDGVAAANISLALNNAEEDRRRLLSEQKQEKKEDKDDTPNRYGVAKFFTKGLQYAEQAVGIGFNYRTSIANGDYLGAGNNALDSASGIVQSVGNSTLGLGITTGNIPLMAIGGAGALVGTIGKIVAGDKKADFAESDAYERSLSHTNALNKLYVNGGTWKQNAMRTNRIFSSGVEYAEDTGLATYDFLDQAANMAKFGAKSADQAMKQTREAALFANATGTDMGAVQNYLGMARRYGDNSDVLGTVSQARQASGLTKAQNQEFLAALQGVIEDGIAGGYVKSTKEAAESLTMLARLSDNNPLWQGQQGATRLRQMDSSIASATNLQTTSHVMTVQAAKSVLAGMNSDKEREEAIGRKLSGTYIDEMLLTEKGTTPALFAQLAKDIQSIEGNNFAAQVERFKGTFNLNYTGAAQVYDMAQKLNAGEITEDAFKKSIETMQKDKTYQSEETRKQSLLNSLDANVANLAQPKFWENLRLLEGQVIKRGIPLPGLSEQEKEEYRKENAINTLAKSSDFSEFNTSATNSGAFYQRFITKDYGDDKKDEAAAKLFAKYQVDTKEELQSVFRTIGSGRDNDNGVFDAYTDGNMDSFISKLESLLQRLNFTLTE